MTIARESLEIAAEVCRECHAEPAVCELAEVFGALRALAKLTARLHLASPAIGHLDSAADVVLALVCGTTAGRLDGATVTMNLARLGEKLATASRGFENQPEHNA
jgi:hypothetical protein